MDVTALIQDFGFPVVMAVGMGYFIYFIYKFTTENIKAKLGQANTALIGLLDRIRMLDNDLIRLRSKLNTVLEMQENEKNNKPRKSERVSKKSIN